MKFELDQEILFDIASANCCVCWNTFFKWYCGGQYKRELMLPCQRASFSGDAVESVSSDHAS